VKNASVNIGLDLKGNQVNNLLTAVRQQHEVVRREMWGVLRLVKTQLTDLENVMTFENLPAAEMDVANTLHTRYALLENQLRYFSEKE